MQQEEPDGTFWAPRECLRNPIPETFEAAMLLDRAVAHHTAGNRNDVVVTCAPCNYGKGDYMLEELGLIDPRLRPAVRTSWDGLERMLIDG
ncbi:MAG: hypothetical protein F4103_11515 [Boseongicola sp. SB0673_bin_14]|nr:hypothetical protein [Boseongicola sp. SB0667_bin_21]MYI69327.1 hypothetical protein [Boseongicola sp. SB0673_bin_14]